MNLRTVAMAPILGLFAALFAAGPALAEEQHLKFRGYAYELESNKFLYTEVHEQRIVDGRWLGGSIAYYGPDGSQIAYKTLDFGSDPFVPVYRLDLKYSGYWEGITGLSPDRIEMSKRGSAQAKVESASIKRPARVAADSGFHAFLRANFAELQAGKTVSFVFAVAGSLDSFKFRAKKVGDATFEGRPAVKLRVEADSLLRLVAPELELLYEPTERKLLEYRGVSNLHDPVSGKAWNARIIYPATPPADAPTLPAGT
ncbi:MAG TPA: hypothetical protein VM240_13770 [Verrucomicrobiae bacterium]|nr:hypothetical protein [Verrucomicrobiae bacterium]